MQTVNNIRLKENFPLRSTFRAASQCITCLPGDGSFDINDPSQAHLHGERHPDRVPGRTVSGIVTARKAAFTSLAATFTRHWENNWISDGPKVW
jgi:hypothetical protein